MIAKLDHLISNDRSNFRHLKDRFKGRINHVLEIFRDSSGILEGSLFVSVGYAFNTTLLDVHFLHVG